MERSSQRYGGKAELAKTLDGMGWKNDTNTITEEALDRIFNDHQNTLDDKSSIYTKSRSARRPIKSLANMRGKMAAQNKGIFYEPSYAEKRGHTIKLSQDMRGTNLQSPIVEA